MKTILKNIFLVLSGISILITYNASASLFSCYDQIEPLNEQISTLQSSVRMARGNLKKLQNKNKTLEIEIVKLRADMEGGRGIIEENKVLETRQQELTRKEDLLAKFESELRERESQLRVKEDGFYKANNMTMQDIGRAQQIKIEYDRIELESTEYKHEIKRLTNFVIWFAIVAVFFLVLAIIVVLKRSGDREKHQAEMEKRKQAIGLATTVLSNSMEPEKARVIVEALENVADVPRVIDGRV
ncbi:hypothetical protein QUF74_15080 [Candidatus Halobeggiatoa sp. HSG11]|nr:hypothetical protein [Candidatus Halobeggiatoa sp. HSG11]